MQSVSKNEKTVSKTRCVHLLSMPAHGKGTDFHARYLIL